MYKRGFGLVMGQPLKLNDNIIVARLIEAVSKGHTQDMAAHYAGIDPSTLYRWINLGRQGEQPYRAFYRKFQKAKAQGALGLLQRIQKERFERALKARYEGGDVDTCKPIIEALRGVNVADPVVYVHSDHACTFVTMTSTKEMPIKITLKSAGKEARTIDNIEHITLHGLPVVSTLKGGFGGGQ